MPSLLWATLVVLLLTYFFAILFMQAAESYVYAGNALPQTLDALHQYYANLPTTMLSLFMAVTGGADWGDIRQPIADVHWAWGLCFIFYVFFVVLGVFNVLIGLFVDRAFDSSKMDKDIVLQGETERRETFMKEVKHMFMEMDSSASGHITRKQFVMCQADPRMTSYMQMHQLNMIEPNFFFKMLDKDGSDSVDLEELIIGMMQFGGQARSSDVMTLIALIRGLREEVKRFSLDTHGRLVKLENMTGVSKL
jgi:Ca2+-binding EF-hand superfamily protein